MPKLLKIENMMLSDIWKSLLHTAFHPFLSSFSPRSKYLDYP